MIVIEFVFVFVVGAYLQVPNQASGIQRQLIKAKGSRVTIALSSTYFDEDDDDNDVDRPMPMMMIIMKTMIMMMRVVVVD